MTSRAVRLSATLGLAGLSLLAACGGAGPRDGGADARTLDVLAASSLTGAFDSLAQRFETDHSGVTVRPVYDSSATLATQVQEGAPADVLATADLDTMKSVVDAGGADRSDVFATNQLVLVTPADNPASVRSISDLDDDGVTFVVCVRTAPCGKVAEELLTSNGVRGEPKSLEVDVKAVLTKVTADEADAGLVYATDARSAGDEVRTFPVPGSERVRNSYAIAVVDQADDESLARDWVDLVLSPVGEKVLTRSGFGPAP